VGVCTGSMIYPARAENGNVYNTSVNLYWKLPWYKTFKFYNMVLIDINMDRALFDYCDKSKYNPAGIAKLVLAHNANATLDNINWIAVQSKSKSNLIADCPALPLTDKYDLFWGDTYSRYIQSTGEIAVG
jgi:hypothetical protein